MFSVKLGGGAVAFEIEAAADQVGTLDPKELEKRGWPKQVIDNYRRYRAEHGTAAAAPSTPPVVTSSDRGDAT
jgi:hypothetical protein